MLHVEHFGLDALEVDVLKHDLTGDTTLRSGKSGSGTNGAGTDNRKLRGANG